MSDTLPLDSDSYILLPFFILSLILAVKSIILSSTALFTSSSLVSLNFLFKLTRLLKSASTSISLTVFLTCPIALAE